MNARPSLALAARTLRIDVRTERWYVLRAALVATMSFVLQGIALGRTRFGAPGLVLLDWLLAVDFCLLTAFGVTAFSAVIAEEREHRGLGLLVLAGLGSGGILLGKAIGALGAAMLLLAVQLPFAALAVALGGVTPHQVLGGFAILAAWTVALSGLGLLASTLCASTTAAARLAVGLVIVVVAAPPLLHALALRAWPGASLTPWLAALADAGVWRALGRVDSTGWSAPLFGVPVLANVALGAAAAAAARLAFARVPLDAFEVGAVAATPERARPLPRPDSGAAALTWKVCRLQGGGGRGRATRAWSWGLAAPVVLVATRTLDPLPARIVVVATLLVAAADTRSLASRVFAEEVQGRTWYALAALPWSVPRVAWAHAGGITRVAAPGAVVATIAVPSAAVHWPHLRLEDLLWLPLAAIACGLAVIWLGACFAAWYSLSAPRAALPLAAATVALFATIALGSLPGRGVPTAPWLGGVLWTVAGISAGLAVSVVQRLSRAVEA